MGESLLPSSAIPGDRFHLEVSVFGPNSSQSFTSYRNISKVHANAKNPGSVKRTQNLAGVLTHQWQSHLRPQQNKCCESGSNPWKSMAFHAFPWKYMSYKSRWAADAHGLLDGPRCWDSVIIRTVRNGGLAHGGGRPTTKPVINIM